MQVTFIFLIVTSSMGNIRMQNWLGTYTINSMCNTTVCCCPTGQILFANYSENIMDITFNTSGQCDEETTLSVLITYPNNYTSSFLIIETTIDMTLDSNSHSIAFVDTSDSTCNYTAVKNNHSMKQHVDLMALFPLIIFNLIMNII